MHPLALGTAPTSQASCSGHGSNIFRPLALDDELITLLFCRANDAENLRHRINSNCCLRGCDLKTVQYILVTDIKLTGSHDYT